jgi:hypothetical protein
MIGFRKKILNALELEKRLLFDASLPAITGQVLWLDADDTSTVVDAEGDNAASGGAFSGSVQTWMDKSASGFNVTAAGATNRPTYTTNILNGNNVLTFDGGTDTLRNTAAVIGGDDYTMFVVFNRTTAAARDGIFEMGSGGSRNALFVNDASGSGKINFYHNGTFYNPSASYTTSAYTLTTATVNTNAYTLTQNGASVGTGTAGSNRVSTTGIYVGNDSSGGDELQGNIAEIIVYDRDLTADERHDVEAYLASKWGLTITNATPVVATNTGHTLDQGDTAILTSAMLAATDTDNTESTLTYTINNISDYGTLFRDADSDGVIDAGEDLALNETFTQGDINSGLIKYMHDGSGNLADSFGFTVTDQLATSGSATFALTMNSINSTPVLTAAGPFSINENIASGTSVTTMAASDADIGDTLTYTIQSGNTGGMFSINAATGEITLSGSPDFETLNIYSLVIRATDDGTGNFYDEETVTININNLNEGPLVGVNTGASVNEGSSVIITSAMLSGSDVDDAGAGLTYTASSLVNGVIEVNGVVQNTFTQADIDAGIVEFVHDGGESVVAGFDISLADGGEDGAAAVTDTFAITVTPVNDAPVIDGWSLVSSENFQSGATGWANNTTTTGVAMLTRYLGSFSNDGGVQSNSKTYNLSGAQDYTVIEFDFYRMDSWDNEQFRIWVNDTQIFGQAFGTGVTTIADGSSGIVSWTASELTQIAGNVAGANVTWTDQIFRFTLTIQNGAASTVKLGFGSTTNQAVSDESWGIDNVKVYEAGDGATPGPFTAAENTANGQVVAKITAGDVEGDAITYSITGGTGSAAFAINSATGIITVLDSSLLNYESTTSFTLQITATDSGSPNLSDVETITINLVDVPENTAPSITAAGPFSLAENAANNTVIGTLSATDAEGNAITWSITGGNTDNIFSINGSGQIRVNSNTNLNYEWDNQYVLTIQAQDNGFGALSGTRNITINITNINEAPTFDTATALLAADPYLRYNAVTGNFYKLVSTAANYATATTNAAAQTLHGIGGHIATVTSSAENTYVRGLSSVQMWLGGSDTTTEGTWRWAGNGSEGGVTFWQGAGSGAGGSVQNSLFANWNGATQPDNSGGGVGEDFMVMLTGAGLWNDVVGTGTNAYIIEWEGSAVLAAAAALQNGAYTIAENSGAGTSVGFLEAFDIDSGDTKTFSATGGTGASLFNVNASTGEITVATGAALNFEGVNSYTLDVRVQDTAGLFGIKTITINLSDVNETPVLTAVGPLGFDENVAGGTSVTTMAGSDVDGGQTLAYSIQSGNTGSMFAIDANTGEITFSGSPNYESVSTYNLVVRVTDNGAGSLYAEQTVTININDINETPLLGAAGPVNFFENTTIGTSLLTVSGSDVDSGQALSYSIQSGNTGNVFAIDAATGEITLAGAVDFETLALYNLVIRVTDDGTGSLFAEQTVTFNIDDLNDAPSDIALSNNIVQENSASNTVIGLLSATDQETGQPHTFTLVNEITGRFTIVGNQLLVAGGIDYEQGATVDLTIRADDGFGGTFDKIFTILVGNVNEYTAAYIAPDARTVTGFNGEVIEEDNRRIFEAEGGNFMRGVILGGDAAQSEGFYGESLVQIIRENVTMLMPSSSFELPLEVSALLQNQEDMAPKEAAEIIIQDQPVRYTNIREALAALEAFQTQEHDQQGQRQDHAHILNGQFEDVLSYHQKRQERLREALS